MTSSSVDSLSILDKFHNMFMTYCLEYLNLCADKFLKIFLRLWNFHCKSVSVEVICNFHLTGAPFSDVFAYHNIVEQAIVWAILSWYVGFVVWSGLGLLWGISFTLAQKSWKLFQTYLFLLFKRSLYISVPQSRIEVDHATFSLFDLTLAH